MPGEVSLSIPVPTYRSVSSAATVRSGKKVKFGEIKKVRPQYPLGQKQESMDLITDIQLCRYDNPIGIPATSRNQSAHPPDQQSQILPKGNHPYPFGQNVHAYQLVFFSERTPETNDLDHPYPFSRLPSPRP